MVPGELAQAEVRPQPLGPGGRGGAGRAGQPRPVNQDKTVAQINVVLNDPPYSNKSLDLVDGQLKDVAHAEAPDGTTALVGGVTASFADIRSANDRDLSVIFPVAGGLIAVILALLLRSLVAPFYLMLSVVLSFFATLGATIKEAVGQYVSEVRGSSFPSDAESFAVSETRAKQPSALYSTVAANK